MKGNLWEDPARLAVAGGSAGGGLSLGLLVAARDAGLPLPAAAVCLSPWTDLAGTGESLDFWRVEEVEKDRLLRLHAEMKLPGEAWLEFKSEPHEGKTLFTVTAYFASRGLLYM